LTTDVYIKVKVDKAKRQDVTIEDVIESVKKDIESNSLRWETSLYRYFTHKYERFNYDE
jgi:hypothetical protein